ncbi:hypothetical protein D3C79_874090 [compost metagenome]
MRGRYLVSLGSAVEVLGDVLGRQGELELLLFDFQGDGAIGLSHGAFPVVGGVVQKLRTWSCSPTIICLLTAS